MNFKKSVWIICGVILSALLFSSCSDSDSKWNDRDSDIELPDQRVFILNEGSWGGNNSTITFYDPFGEVDQIDDIYYEQNGQELGDLGQCMVKYKTNIFVVVNGSRKLVKLNTAGVQELEFSIPAEYGDPRYIVEKGGKLYLTVYGYPGRVLRINPKTFSIEAAVEVGGNPEDIVELNGKLYVSNTEWGDGNTLSIIDIKKFEEIDRIEVNSNPRDMIAAGGDVYLISWGENYDDYRLQCIHNDDFPEEEVKVSKMAVHNGIIYCTYTSYVDYSPETTRFYTYNTVTKKWDMDSFLDLTSVPELNTAIVYMLVVDPYNGDIYIGTTDYITNGDIYRFQHDGTFIEKFESGGINPNGAVFFK